MPCWSLGFEGPLTWEELAEAGSSVASALTGRTDAWADEARMPLEDPNGLQRAFRWVFTRPDAELELTQEAGHGNPRDGYAYHRTFQLTLREPALTLRADEDGYEDHFRSLDLHFDAEHPARVDTIREALRAVLGVTRDASAGATLAKRNVVAALPLDEARARAWLSEARSLGPQASGWMELLELAARVEGSSPELLAQRLREAPHDAAAWAEATPATAGISAELLAEARRRLSAQAPSAGWRRLDDGMGPTPDRRGLGGRLDAALWGDALPTEQSELPALPAEGAARRTLRAAWGTGALPRMIVEVETRVARDVTTTLHLWGEGPADRVVLRWVVVEQARQKLHLGYAAATEGSPAFQERAWSALYALHPCRWEPASAESLFAEREPRDGAQPQGTPGEPRGASVLTMLARLSEEALPELSAALETCRCREPRCPHVRRVVDLQRARVPAAARAELWDEHCRLLAIDAALDALTAALQERPEGVELALARAERHLRTREALRPGVKLSDTRA